MRIGIFGGSFNPPHKLHEKIATYLLENNYVEKVIFVPTGNRYPKEALLESQYRYHMIKEMIKDSKNMEVSDYELKNTLTYTYQTLSYFQEKFKNDKIFFITGADNLKEIKTWKNYQYILEHFNLYVLPRKKQNVKEILSHLPNENIFALDFETEDVSSTDVRKAIKEHCEEYLNSVLDENVLEYIRKEGLYQ